MHLPERIASACAEIAVLDDEKIVLAENLIKLLSLAKARLDVDFVKVKTLQGEPIEDNRNLSRSFSQSSQLYPSIALDKRSDAMSGINSIAQINQSLRNASVNMQAETFVNGPGYNKSKWLNIPSIHNFDYVMTVAKSSFTERRITTNTAMKLSSPTRGSTPQAVSRSRPPRQAQMIEPEDEDLDADAEGEEDYEAEDAEEDSTLYCFCNKQSYGDVSTHSPVIKFYNKYFCR